jgi:hypothetical protein
VDNSLPRVPAHTHCATTTALSLRNPMVDPLETSPRLVPLTDKACQHGLRGTVNLETA